MRIEWTKSGAAHGSPLPSPQLKVLIGRLVNITPLDLRLPPPFEDRYPDHLQAVFADYGVSDSTALEIVPLLTANHEGNHPFPRVDRPS